MLHKVQNLMITGGTFNIYENHDDVLTTLWKHACPGAIFDSVERSSAGKCHPDTRKTIIEWITEWINEVNPDHPSRTCILWLYGSAGAGKSAIMQTICEAVMDSSPERYGGSFFFARGNTDRGKGAKLFTTLAYQLACQFPCVREEINAALRSNPSFPTKAIDIQLQALIIEPLLRCKDFPSNKPVLIPSENGGMPNRSKSSQVSTAL